MTALGVVWIAVACGWLLAAALYILWLIVEIRRGYGDGPTGNRGTW